MSEKSMWMRWCATQFWDRVWLAWAAVQYVRRVMQRKVMLWPHAECLVLGHLEVPAVRISRAS